MCFMLLMSIIKSLNKFDILNLVLSFISAIVNIYFPITNPIWNYFWNGAFLLFVIILIGCEKIENYGKEKNDKGIELKELINEKNYISKKSKYYSLIVSLMNILIICLNLKIQMSRKNSSL